MNLVLFNFHDIVLVMTIALYFLLASAHVSLFSLSRLSFVSLALFCLASAAIPMDILISFGAEFRDFSVKRFPHLFYIFDMGYWLQAPLWYIFLKSLLEKQKQLHWFDIILFVPFILFVLHQTFTFYLLPTSEKIGILNGQHPSSFSVQYVLLLRETLRLIVMVLGLRIIYKYLFKDAKKQETPKLIYTLPWPIPFTIALSFLSAVSVIDILLIIFSENGSSVIANTLGLTSNYLSLLTLIIIVGISINTEPLYSGNKHAPLKNHNTVDKNHIALIEKAMEEEKLYLNNDLSLESLANHIGLSPRAVSLVINRHFNCNFFEYVNRYRINEAREMMENEKFSHCNILDIMLETGFNSKATFNTFFKKQLGMTPREYRKQIS